MNNSTQITPKKKQKQSSTGELRHRCGTVSWKQETKTTEGLLSLDLGEVGTTGGAASGSKKSKELENLCYVSFTTIMKKRLWEGEEVYWKRS